MRRLAIVAALVLLLPGLAAGQALPNLSLARVRYNTLKATAKPDGELKAQIDAIDRGVAEAVRLGRHGEARRLLARGTALLRGQAWTPEEDYRHSLVVRAERVFADAARPLTVRLEQIYAPDLALDRAPAAVVTLRPLLAQPPGAPDVLTLARVPDVSRDLRESPLVLDLDVSGVPEGPHELAIDVRRDDEALGQATLRVFVLSGLDGRAAALDAASAAAPPALQADIAYPLDMMRKINRGLIEVGGFDLPRELEAAETVARAAAGGINPFAGRTGDFERHYRLEAAGEIMPYRVYVPTGYRSERKAPLVIALHGLGATEDSFFDGYQRTVPRLAEQHGFLVAAPLGYRVDGFYGSTLMAGADPAAARRSALSEQDVLEVVRRMQADYAVDPDRVYLIGHSMGAIGAWALAAKHPGLWAAVVPFSGTGAPAAVARMKHIPQFVVHGDADATVNVNGSRAMVAELRRLGVEVTYVEVPGGSHTDVVVPHLPRAFEWLATRRRAALAAQ